MKYVCNTDFGAYLAGLWEGDGHISMPTKKHKHNPRWHITFHEKDYVLAQALNTKLGGFIRHKPKQRAKVLTLSSVPSLKSILKLTHQAYRSPKIRQVNLLINWLNQHHATDFDLAFKDNSSLNNNAWLAGFIDADGSFGLRHTQGSPTQKRRIACRFRLEQRMVDAKSNVSYEPLMSAISTTLACKLKTRIQTRSQRRYFLVETSSVVSNTKLASYLRRYPLFSSKWMSFKIWASVHAKLKSKKAYEASYAPVLKAYKQSINAHARICENHLKKL